MNIVITAGGTTEHIDAVRAITNTGTGTLASIIADRLVEVGNPKIFYIHTPKAKLPTSAMGNFEFIQVEDTNSVAEAVKKVLTENKIDWFIHAMAISDYYVDHVTTAQDLASYLFCFRHGFGADQVLSKAVALDNSKKLSSEHDNLLVVLKKTPKIIGMIKDLSPDTHLIGFKLLNNVSDEELVDVAYHLLEKNRCEYVVANDSAKISATQHEALILDRNRHFTRVYTNEEIALSLASIITMKPLSDS